MFILHRLLKHLKNESMKNTLYSLTLLPTHSFFSNIIPERFYISILQSIIGCTLAKYWIKVPVKVFIFSKVVYKHIKEATMERCFTKRCVLFFIVVLKSSKLLKINSSMGVYPGGYACIEFAVCSLAQIMECG